MPSRRRRHPNPSVSDDHSAESSIVSSQHLHGCVQEYANVVLVHAEHDAFLVQGNTKTPKISNRGRLDAQIPQTSHVSHVFRHVTGRSSNESLEMMREPSNHHRAVSSNSVEALNSTKAPESIRVCIPSRDKNSISQDTKKRASREHVDCNDNFVTEQNSKAKRAKRVSVDEEHGHQSTKKQACTLREPNSCSAQRDRTTSPDTVDAMDCSSGESLDMDLSTQLITSTGYVSPGNTLDHGSITSSTLGKLCKSKVDNPEIMAAMFASYPSARFPLGCTIGGEEFQSLDASEITMRTMQQLEMGSKKNRFPSHLIRSQTDPSNFVENQYFEADKTIISVATRTARNKCLSILKGGRRSLSATTFPSDVDRSTNNTNLIFNATDKGIEANQSNEDGSLPRKQSPQNLVTINQGDVNSKDAPTIIRLDRLPKPSTNHVFFEYNGEIFQHAPLPSGWEVRMSKSKNRLFYTHPDRGATWYCPVVNPIGASESASLSIVPSSVKETIGCALMRTPEDETTTNFDHDSHCSSAIDAEDSRDSTGSSGLFVRSIDEDPDSTPYIKAGEGGKYEDCSISMSRTLPVRQISIPVKRSVTVEQDDLKSHSSDTTAEKPAKRAVEYPANQSCISTTPRVSKFHANDCSTQKSPRDEIHLNVASPDEEIASLVLVNLAHRRMRVKGTTLLALYPSDRIDSPSQLSAAAHNGKFHDEASPRSHQAKQGGVRGSPYHSYGSPPIDNRVLSLFHSPDTLLPDQLGADQDDCDVVEINWNSQNVRANDFSTFDDDVHVQSGNHRTFKRFEQGSEVQLQKLTTADACCMQVITRNREAECAMPYSDKCFHNRNMVIHTSADNQHESDRSIADDGDDGLATESFNASEDVTDSRIDDNAVLASNTRHVFHPNVVETNSVCSISTLGEYRQESCAGGTFLSKMSFRILNPPHPICALQKLDQILLIAGEAPKLTRIHARQFRGLKSYGKFSVDACRRLDFLESL